MKIDWDRVWFINKVLVIHLVGLFMVFCTVVAASWGGMLVSMTTNYVFGAMFASWAFVVGLMGRSWVTSWLFMKMIVPELGTKKD